MKKETNLKILRQKIESLRNKLLNTAKDNDLSEQIVQEISQELDELIFKYTKEKNR